MKTTHEALIDQEDWETVQRIRAGRRRLNKQEIPALFSGLLYCADCGSLLRVHRGKTSPKGRNAIAADAIVYGPNPALCTISVK